MKSNYEITMFGEFTISNGKEIITDQANRSKKVWTLLEYLIVHRDRSVTQKELVDLLWPGSDTKDPINTLKVLMHRVRSLLDELGKDSGKKMIYYKSGAYGWNDELKCSVDTEQFDIVLNMAEEAEDSRKLDYLLRAVRLYAGDFLQKNGSEPWIMQLSGQYRGKFLKAASKACQILLENGENEEVINTCKHVIKFCPYEEEFYIYLLKALIRTQQADKAQEEYHRVSELFFREFGITPSDELTAIYKEVVETSHMPELNLEIIKEKLVEEPTAGSFYCEFEFFKTIYRLEARSSARTGQSVYIGLMTVMNAAGDDLPNQKTTNRVMDALHDTIRRTLRRGDIFTRYSLNQYLIMLPTTTYETSNMVMERIRKAYRREFPNTPVSVRCSTTPVTPDELNR
ncbi:MAG: winged helix-turn-helix domain-containing protein [Anaerotignum sp.]|nr:winged helix-turn-helix domain-containing protein [Anaerotignum sp.]